MSKRHALVAAMLVASIFSIGAAVAKSGQPDTLPDNFLRETRGGSATAGQCSVSCTQWQAIDGQSGNWSCAGDDNDKTCVTCSVTTNITYDDTTSNACPGMWYTQDNSQTQDCGLQVRGGTCEAGECTGGTADPNFDCDDPNPAAKHSGH